MAFLRRNCVVVLGCICVVVLGCIWDAVLGCIRDFFSCSNFIPIVSVAIAVVACILACKIPKKIMHNHTYINLMSEYRSHEMGIAIFAVCSFFDCKCSKTVGNIQKRYIKLYKNEITNPFTRRRGCNLKNTLHFQRRMLTQYFTALETLRRDKGVTDKQLKKDFTKKEYSLLRILYEMNIAADDKIINISAAANEPYPISPLKNNMNELIKSLSLVFKDCE